MLPAALLFFLIAWYFRGARDTRLLYLVFSAVALSLASALLYAAWSNGAGEPSALISELGSPALLVPNDAALLAVVAPLSLTVLYLEGHTAAKCVAALSILATVCVVSLLQSRVAVITLGAAVVATGMFVRWRRGLLWGLVILAVALAVDGSRGFPLLVKFAKVLDPRLSLWLASLAMFLDAPLLGHGPHTFGLMYGRYLTELDLPAWLPADSRIVPWAHNLYLEVLAEQGIVGFGTLLLLLASGMAVGWRVYRTRPGETRVLAGGALAGLCGLCLAALFELSFLRQWVVITTFTLLGVIAQLSSSQSHPTEV